MTKRNMPWSLKGVTPEARDAARAAAQREGTTIGAWLERTIRTAAAHEAGLPDDDAGAPSAAAAPAAAPAASPRSAPTTDADAVQAALARLEQHLEASERRAADAVAPLQQSVGSLLDRLEAVERDLADDRQDP